MTAELIINEDDVAEAVAYWLEKEHEITVDATELESITRQNSRDGFYGFRLDIEDRLKVPALPRVA